MAPKFPLIFWHGKQNGESVNGLPIIQKKGGAKKRKTGASSSSSSTAVEISGTEELLAGLRSLGMSTAPKGRTIGALTKTAAKAAAQVVAASAEAGELSGIAFHDGRIDLPVELFSCVLGFLAETFLFSKVHHLVLMI